MQIYSLAIIKHQSDHHDLIMDIRYLLEKEPWRFRSTIKQTITFLTRTLSERVPHCTLNQIHEEIMGKVYVCHITVRSDSYGYAIITDEKYPVRLIIKIFGHLDQIIDKNKELLDKTVENKDKFKKKEYLNLPEIKPILDHFSNPEETDKILKVKKSLEETKVVMFDTIEKVLERGVKIEDLVKKSDDLNNQSKLFLLQTKKLNRCCVIL